MVDPEVRIQCSPRRSRAQGACADALAKTAFGILDTPARSRASRLEEAVLDEGKLTITDSRTGLTYTLPITEASIRALELRPIRRDPDEFGMLSYDPGYTNTASCTSRIAYIDGSSGILRYRGYPIEKLAENCTYTEVAYLLLNGELPTRQELEAWDQEVIEHSRVHENVKKFMNGFLYDAHPMGVLVSTVAALSTFYPDAKKIESRSNRYRQQVAPSEQDPNDCCVCLPQESGLSVSKPGLGVELHRELHPHALERDAQTAQAGGQQDPGQGP